MWFPFVSTNPFADSTNHSLEDAQAPFKKLYLNGVDLRDNYCPNPRVARGKQLPLCCKVSGRGGIMADTWGSRSWGSGILKLTDR